MSGLLKCLPKPLLEDIVDNRCLPIIGAGFSKNADLPSGVTMPLWKDLGESFAKEIEETYPFSTPLDAISAYAHEFTRVKLIEKLTEFLHVRDARPGAVHKAFCELPFDIVVTTNFDFLLEEGFATVSRYCHTIVGEDELSVRPPSNAVALIKLHGDLHHPDRMIVTEDDYDSFLEKYPLMATFLSNLLISRTPLFIGYSLEDQDFRQVWQVIGDRLGRLRRPAYSISMELPEVEVKRFERRGVRVINIQRSSSYGETLVKLFNELRDYWPNFAIEKGIASREETSKELFLPPRSPTRLCLFVIPLKLKPFYQDNVFNLVESYGFVPVTADDIVSPGENKIAKEMGLFDRAEIIIMDVSSATQQSSAFALGQAIASRARILLIAESGFEVPSSLNVVRIEREKDVFADPESLLQKLEEWLKTVSEELQPRLEAEPLRLLKVKEYKAAFISAMTLLETSLRKFLAKDLSMSDQRAPFGLSQMFRMAFQRLELSAEETSRIYEWIKVRNLILHENKNIYQKTAIKAVNDVLKLVTRIQRQKKA